MSLRRTQILWGCLITWLQSADLGPFSSYKRHTKNAVDVSVSSKTLQSIRTQYIAKNLEIGLWYSNEFQFPISTSFPICLFLNIKVKTDFEVLLTCHIKEHRELTYRTLLQNLSLKSLCFSTKTSNIVRRLFTLNQNIKLHKVL